MGVKKLYTRFFHIPKHEKIGEKTMLLRVATTIATIVGCLIAMSLTAYAYFSCDVSSVLNVIQAANFDAEIAITDENNTLVEPSAKEGKISTFIFTVPGTYTVTLGKGTSSAQTGFCVLYIGEDTYHTQQIGVDIGANNQNRESVSFTLQVKGPETVKIESHWGTSSHYDYTENECYIVDIIVVGTATNTVTDTGKVTTTTTTKTEISVSKTAETTSTTTIEQSTASTTEHTTTLSTETTTTVSETSVTKTTESTIPTETTSVQTTTFPQTTNITETTTVSHTAVSVTTTVSDETTTENVVTTEQTQPVSETTAVDTGASTA